MKNNRYALIDTLRGLALLSMIVYHALWSMSNLFAPKIVWLSSTPAYLWQQSTAALFIFISGFCWAFSHKHLKRGLIILGCAVFIFIFTYLFNEKHVINFGILFFIGSAMLLMIPLSKLLKIIPSLMGITVSFILFFLTKNINNGYAGFNIWHYALPENWYANYFTAYWGLPPASFHSADYFPLLPWIFIYTAGYFIFNFSNEFISKTNVYQNGYAPLAVLGRHSLPVYLIHQPVIYCVLWIWYNIIN